MVKPTGNSSDGPEAKKAKIDPNETTMVKKVNESILNTLYVYTCLLVVFFIAPAKLIQITVFCEDDLHLFGSKEEQLF